MRTLAEQIFFGAIIELVSMVLSYVFKSKPRTAIIIFTIGTIVAGVVAFGPVSQTQEPEPTPTAQVSTSTSPPSEESAPATETKASQFDPDDPEGFLKWYFHEIWATRDYENLWDYQSDDFRQRVNQSYPSFVKNWDAIGSIEEPIEIAFEGQDGISLKYRVTYTTLSRKSGYADHRTDLFLLYFNTSKGHWEFK